MDCARLYRNGRVAGVDGSVARIVFDSFEACSGCRGGCGMSQLARLLPSGSRGVLRVDVGLESGLATGDAVRVGIEAARLLRLVSMTYCLPLFGIVAGAALASLLVPAAGDIVALSGAALGALVSGGMLLARSASSGPGRTLDWLGVRVTRLASNRP